MGGTFALPRLPKFSPISLFFSHAVRNMIDLVFDDDAKREHETNVMFANGGWPDTIFLVPDWTEGECAGLTRLGVGWWGAVISHETLHVVINKTIDVKTGHMLDNLYEAEDWFWTDSGLPNEIVFPVGVNEMDKKETREIPGMPKGWTPRPRDPLTGKYLKRSEADAEGIPYEVCGHCGRRHEPGPYRCG